MNSKVPAIVFKDAKLDFSKVMESVRRLVSTLRKKKNNFTIEKYDNVEVIEGKAYFISPSTVMVESNNGKFEARADYLIATGSRPSIPPIDGLNSIDYLTSDTIWQLNKLPNDLIVIGGGTIGLERAVIELDTKGAIKVNTSITTSNPKVYAAGDVVSKSLMLETLAAREGVIVTMNVFSNGKMFTLDYLEVPWTIFTYPNLAAVGMSEEEVIRSMERAHTG